MGKVERVEKEFLAEPLLGQEKKEFPSKEIFSFPEERLSQSKDEKEFLNNLNPLLAIFSFLGIALNTSDILKLFDLSKDPNKNLRDIKEIADNLPDYMGIREKALRIALMNIMEFCHTYGCIPEVKKLVYEWDKKKFSIKRYKFTGDETLEHLSEMVKESEYKLSKSVYMSRFVYNIRKSIEALEQKNYDVFINYIAELGKEKNLDAVAASIVLNHELEKELEKKEPDFGVINKAIESLEKSGIDYNIKYDLKADEYKEKEEIKELEIKGNEYAVIISADVIKEALKKDQEIEVELVKSKGHVLIKILTSNQITVSFSGDGLFIVIDKDSNTQVTVSSNNKEQKLDVGFYKIKGPLSIKVTSVYGNIFYHVKEPVLVNLSIRNIEIINAIEDNKN